MILWKIQTNFKFLDCINSIGLTIVVLKIECLIFLIETRGPLKHCRNPAYETFENEPEMLSQRQVLTIVNCGDRPVEGWVVSHICGKTKCLNPDHVRFETKKMDIARKGCHKKLRKTKRSKGIVLECTLHSPPCFLNWNSRETWIWYEILLFEIWNFQIHEINRDFPILYTPDIYSLRKTSCFDLTRVFSRKLSTWFFIEFDGKIDQIIKDFPSVTQSIKEFQSNVFNTAYEESQAREVQWHYI